MELGALIAGLGIRPVGGKAVPAPVRICDITEDSRTVMPGSLFVARRGEKSDGRNFVGAAVEAGAVAVLTDDPKVQVPAKSGAALLVADDIQMAAAMVAERFYGSPSGKLAVIGVTGTNGKTTTTYLIHQILNRAGKRCGLVGTVCVDDGVEVAPAALTTPPSLELSRTLARMVEAGCVAAAIEASSHALDQRRVGAVQFKVGVFTNLTHDHLDYHGTMDTYAAAKAVLFAMLPEDGVAVVNVDDAASARMIAATGPGARIVRCTMKSRGAGTEPGADVAARVVSATASVTVIELTGPWDGKDQRGWRVRLPLIGAHNVMNAMQAAAAAWGVGIDGETIRTALEHVHAPPGRLEPVTGAEHPLAVYVDYAHSDDSLTRAMQVMRAAIAGGGKLTVVFGCGGDRDRTKRPKMGAAAAMLADRLVVTSDNPRTEEPGTIIDQVLGGVPAAKRNICVVEVDRGAAIRRAVSEAKDGDIVLIAGKGHEDYQILPDGRGGTRKIHFDDREVARAALTERGMHVTAPAGAGLVAATGARRGVPGGGAKPATRHQPSQQRHP
ncbi:MAG: UDP-N-acetylmuramoyl-L-alanyl-D-glutamate--2,6-diaminopimelate ligase [Phycisphaerales bacterium]